MLAGYKITEIFVMADEFCKKFDAHCDCRMSQAEIMVIMYRHKYRGRYAVAGVCE